MKKLLGLLALAPMTLAACGGNATDTGTDGGSDNGGSDTGTETTVKAAYENTTWVGQTAALEEVAGATEQGDIDYNSTIASINGEGVGEEINLEDSQNFMKHDWTITNEFEMSAGGNTFNVEFDYVLNGDTLYQRMIMPDYKDQAPSYQVYDLTIANEMLTIETMQVKSDDSVDLTVIGNNYKIRYDGTRLYSVIFDGNDYVSVVGSSEDPHTWETYAANKDTKDSLSISEVNDGSQVIHHDSFADNSTLIDLGKTLKIPGTTATVDTTVKAADFVAPTTTHKYADVVAKFA